MVNRLMAEGISPSRIQWADLAQLCQASHRAHSDAYNQCRLSKARLQYDFTEDQQTCQEAAQAFRPHTLRYRAVLLDGHPSDHGATLVTLLNSVPAVTNEEAFHSYLYTQCMQRQGWRNPRDYRRGYRDPSGA